MRMRKKTKLLVSLAACVWLGCVALTLAAEPGAYRPPRLEAPNAWSLILLPVLQTYHMYGRNQGISDLMTAWVAENLQPLRVLTVLCVGDLVEQNNIDKPIEGHCNQNSAQQWGAVSRVMARLDGRTPYILVTGNHDYGFQSAENRDTRFNEYFPATRNPAWKGVLVECGPNHAGQKTLENAAYAFTTPQGRKLLVLALEFAPSDAVLAWAKELAARPAYSRHLVILITHSYMKSLSSGNTLTANEKYKVPDTNYGQAIWEKLVYPADNIRLVLCGHIAGTNGPRDNVGFRVDANHAG